MTGQPPGRAGGATGPRGAEERRRAVRVFVRTHHPDVGGDIEAFVAGLDRLRAGGPGARPGLPAEDDPRLDVPVVGVPPPLSVRVLRRLVRALRGWLARRPAAPSRVR
ncbi:MAG TPA: hypothetical protein VGH99_03595 [Pseudonocardia sp.]